LVKNYAAELDRGGIKLADEKLEFGAISSN